MLIIVHDDNFAVVPCVLFNFGGVFFLIFLSRFPVVFFNLFGDTRLKYRRYDEDISHKC